MASQKKNGTSVSVGDLLRSYLKATYKTILTPTIVTPDTRLRAVCLQSGLVKVGQLEDNVKRAFRGV